MSPVAFSLLCAVSVASPFGHCFYLEHGADITATNNEGYTALGLAVSLGNKNGKLTVLSTCCIRVRVYSWNTWESSNALFDQSHFLL